MQPYIRASAIKQITCKAVLSLLEAEVADSSGQFLLPLAPTKTHWPMWK